MCGRFYVDDETAGVLERIAREVDLRLGRMRTGDIYPSQKAGVLAAKAADRELDEIHWGFLPEQRKGLLINARAETALQSRMFGQSMRYRRCVIPAKHFYEWDAQKNKVTFFREDGAVLYLAGCYQRFAEGLRFIILTTKANASVSPVHDRMPVILEKRELADWIYEDDYTQDVLHRVPLLLGRTLEYEQQRLIFDT